MEKVNDNQLKSIPEEMTENGVTRRQIIKTGAAAGAVALMGGFPNISSAQNKTLNIVRGTYFIPAAQEIAKQQQDPLIQMQQQELQIKQMEAQAKTVCQNGGKILNVGFGMGYIDDAIQTYDIEHHTIIECHPDVWQKMREDGWMNKPNVECIFGTWQE